MNYRHAYHAGNFADVVKHVVITRIVEYLKRKEAAFRVIDTHAGAGRYDLRGLEAGKTGEWQAGIGRLKAAVLPANAANLLAPYLDVVRGENRDGGFSVYPGSPLLVRRLLRSQDRLSAIELHRDDAKALTDLFAGDHQVRVIRLDGWLALGAHLPPKEKRGFVFVDPPYEKQGDFGRFVGGLVKARRRFAGGIYALWYPVKNRREVADFLDAVYETGIPNVLKLELSVRPLRADARLKGSGLVVVNPPFTLEAEMRIVLPQLAEVLAELADGDFQIDWIRGE